MTPRPPLDEQKSLWEATIAAEGITTGNGAADGKSIVDARLAFSGANSFLSMLMVVYPGQPRLVDSMDITGFTNGTGEVIFDRAYKGVAAAIPAGVPYKIVTFRFVPAEVAALAAAVADLTDAVYLDSINGVPGTAYPIGTPGNPVNNWADAKVIAAARKTSTIKLAHGVITLTGEVESALPDVTTDQLAYTLVQEVILTANHPALDVAFDLMTDGGGATAYGQIWVNDAPVGTVQTDITGAFVTFRQHLVAAFVAGDRIQIYAQTDNALQLAHVQNFYVREAFTGYRFIGNGFSDPNGDGVENWIDPAEFTATECSFEYINIDYNGTGILDKCGHFLRCRAINPATMTACSNFFNCGYVAATTMTACSNFFNCGSVLVPTMTNCSNFFNCGYVNTATMTSCNYFFNCGYVDTATMTSCSEFFNCGYVNVTTMTNCSKFFNCGEANIAYDCTGLVDDVLMSFRTGIIAISNLTGAFTFTITGDSLRLTIVATCTAGIINAYGDVIVTDNSAGTTVNDYSIYAEQKKYARVPVTVASANLKNSNDTEKTTIALVYTRIKEIIIGAGLAGVRINFELKTAGGGATATARIYKNGAAVGAVQTDATGGYVTKSEDLTSFAAGDKIQIYAFTDDAAQAAYVQNFRLLYDITDTLVAVSNDP